MNTDKKISIVDLSNSGNKVDGEKSCIATPIEYTVRDIPFPPCSPLVAKLMAKYNSCPHCGKMDICGCDADTP